MRGTKVKRLRKEFNKKNSRAPTKSEFRRIKKQPTNL